jgi:hypothetical protein
MTAETVVSLESPRREIRMSPDNPRGVRTKSHGPNRERLSRLYVTRCTDAALPRA